MANASHDENSVPTKTGVLNTNGTTVMKWYVNPTNGALVVDNDTIGTYPGGSKAAHDENDVATAMGVSSVDNLTPVKVLINSSNKLLINSH